MLANSVFAKVHHDSGIRPAPVYREEIQLMLPRIETSANVRVELNFALSLWSGGSQEEGQPLLNGADGRIARKGGDEPGGNASLSWREIFC